ncbi:MAG TPA: hypothetical protein PLP82_06275 [Deltaproteobacteria bacterium]|jgi:hypothetical protein|nr:hypothetical protein [Deltaproteobacteria bacterium]OQC24332.1 MAG: hypothetical protein BWX71_01860 [Deltaproteobacteria bacterium ADurb.Bin072]HRW79921.1 hypothetical protein [Desulfomonilia bacterium]NMD39777.1 hypothetical protein [Deltaproteobacteria bacterium]HNQ86167.1 hypothetical protein [Deltaproteobacteria bacterium]
MADKAMLTNRIVLRSIMPLFKILHEEDDTLLKHFLTRFEGVIQLAVKGTDIGAHIELKDRKLDVVQGIHPNPDILLPFKHISGMNALFTGGIPVFGGFPRGLARLGLLTKLVTLLLGLLILMPNVHPKAPAKRLLKVKMIMYMVTNALSQLNKGGDEDMMDWTAKQPDRVYQMSVQPEGPAAYLRVKGGRTKSGHGMYTRKAPFVHMKFNGLDGAYKVLAEAKDTVSATADGDIRLEGSPEYAGAMGSFMIRIQDMLMPPKK